MWYNTRDSSTFLEAVFSCFFSFHFHFGQHKGMNVDVLCVYLQMNDIEEKILISSTFEITMMQSSSDAKAWWEVWRGKTIRAFKIASN